MNLFNKEKKDNKIGNIIIFTILIIELVLAYSIYKKYHKVTNVSELAFIDEEINLNVDNMIKLEYQSKPNYPSSDFKWSSNNECVEVDNRGYIKTRCACQAIVTIKASNKSASIKINVTDNEI